MSVDDAGPRDEVSYSDYVRACGRLEIAARALRDGDPDASAEHWLPQLTAQVQLIFSFVGSNMTARHVPKFVRTIGEYERAKDVLLQTPPSGRLPDTNPQQEEHDGGIAGEPGPGPGPAGGPDRPGEPADG